MPSKSKRSRPNARRSGSSKRSRTTRKPKRAAARISGQFEGNIDTDGELHITPGAKCRANIRASKVRIDGEFEGSMAARRAMQISQSGRCRGSVSASSLFVDGEFEGETLVADRMDLSPKARMRGEIVATRLVIADGASFAGRITVGRFVSGKQTKSRRKAA